MYKSNRLLFFNPLSFIYISTHYPHSQFESVTFHLQFSHHASGIHLQVAVVSDKAGGALDVLADAGAGLTSQVLHEGDDLVRVGDALERHEVGSKAGHVGRGCRES